MTNKESLIKALSTRYELDFFIKNVLSPVFDSRVEIYSRPQKRQLSDSDKKIVKSIDQYGHVVLENGQILMLHEVMLADKVKPNQAKVGMASILKKHIPGLNAELVNFINPARPDSWRLSLIAKHKSLESDGSVKDKGTDLRRFSYVLGPAESCRTAGERLTQVSIKQVFSVDALIDAFEVDKLSKEFFNEYKYTHYNGFVKHLSGIEIKKKSKGDEFTETSKPAGSFKSSFRGDAKKVRDFVKRMLGRILFLYFVQKKGWLEVKKEDKWQPDYNFLQNLFNECSDQENFYSVYLRKLFFETLNSNRKNDEAEFIKGKLCRIPFLNGGLFENDEPETDWVTFPSELYEKLFEFLNRHNFTIDEDGPKDQTVAVDPEMLGHIFENLLEDNKDKGTFYTPKEIVHYMCQESLIDYLSTYLKRASGITNESTWKSLSEGIEKFIRLHLAEPILSYDKLILSALKEVKICDPAIGSGAFPMGLLQEIFQAVEYLHTITPDTVEEVWGLKGWEPSKVKLDIIENSIYGVDIEKGAVDIARLRFWLSLVVDEESARPLPNLDYKIVEGNSLLSKFNHEVINIDWSNRDVPSIVKKEKDLIERAFGDLIRKEKLVFEGDKDKAELQTQIRDLKIEILTNQIKINRIRFEEGNKATGSLFGPTKDEKVKSFDVQQRLTVLGRMLTKLEALKRNKEPLKFFDWKLDFPDILNDQIAKESGFDIVIGNPPYVQLQRMGEEADLLEQAGYATFVRTGDIYCLFYEKGHSILKAKGVLTYITSNKWMRASYGQAIRKYFIEKCNPLKLIDFAGYQVFENATVDTNILISEKSDFSGEIATCSLGEDLNDLSYLSDYFRQHQTRSYNLKSESSWAVMNFNELSIKRKIEEKGIPLSDWDVQINYGIKTGFNKAFIIDSTTRDEIIKKSPKSDEIIRPILLGKDIKHYSYKWDGLWLINSHNGIKSRSIPRIDLQEEYPIIFKYLSQFKSDLVKRQDQGDHWSNLRNCAYLDDFSKPKIAWGNLALKSQFAFIDNDYFINAPSPFFVSKNLYLLAILNSSVGEYYIKSLGVARSGGYIEFKPMFVEQVPIPKIDEVKQVPFSDLASKIIDCRKNGLNPKDLEDKLNQIVFELYELTEREADLLLAAGRQ